MNAHIKITTESNAFSIDTDIEMEDAAKLLEYTLQFIRQRNSQPERGLSLEDKIVREVQSIQGGKAKSVKNGAVRS